MKNKLMVVGTKYIDYRDFIGCRIGQPGGIFNFMKAYGEDNCDYLITDYRKCWFSPKEDKMVKTKERFEGCDSVSIPNVDCHICYGDSLHIYTLAKKALPYNDSETFVSVDFIRPFHEIDGEVLEFWGKYADFIFVAADDQKFEDIPKVVRDSKALWIFHNPKWVITMCPWHSNEILTFENEFYEPMLDTIGAGDYFAGCILRKLFEEGGNLEIKESFEEVRNILKVQNDVQYGSSVEW